MRRIKTKIIASGFFVGIALLLYKTLLNDDAKKSLYSLYTTIKDVHSQLSQSAFWRYEVDVGDYELKQRTDELQKSWEQIV